MQMTSWKHWAVGGVAAFTILAGGLWTADDVSAAELEPVATATMAQSVQPAGFGPGARMDRGYGVFDQFDRSRRLFGDDESLLADALGITVEELDAAEEEARSLAHDAALAQAVADGDLTQEQADAIQELEGLWGDRSFGRFGMDGSRGYGVAPRMGLDEQDGYLAQALGITLEELEAAKQQALEAGVAQAVSDETITQEQADELLAGFAMRQYLAGELESALASAVEKAVAEGVVTQEQADALQDDWRGFGPGGMHGLAGPMHPEMHHGMRGGMGGGWDDFGKGMRGRPPGGRWNESAAPDTQSNPVMTQDGGANL